MNNRTVKRQQSQSLHIGTFFGIPVKIHWTFGFLLLFIAYLGYRDGLSVNGYLWLGLTVISLFTCVVLHEYGHALAARRYGVRTRDILLTPIGGIARLKGMPKKPMHEFVIAIAGPLVNVAIMILAFFYLLFTINPESGEILEDLVIIDNFQELVLYLFFLNMILFLFNLIPAFPMDGGRILRSLLSIKLKKTQATLIASVIGQTIAGLFVAGALYFGQFTLGFIGVFVFIMARREYKMVVVEDMMEKALVSDVLRSNFSILYSWEPIQKALDIYKGSEERSFLVFNQFNQIEGVIHELFLNSAEKHFQSQDQIRTIQSSRFEFVTHDLPLKDLFKLMQEKGYSIVPVFNENGLIGVVDRNDLMKFVKKVK